MLSKRLETLAEELIRLDPRDEEALHARREELQDIATELRTLGPTATALASGLDAARLLGARLADLSAADRPEAERLLMQCVVFVANGVERLDRKAAGKKPKGPEPAPAVSQPFPKVPERQDTQAMASSLRRGAVSPLRLTTETHLGEILQRMGVIDSRGMARALEVQRATGMLLGEALVEAGVCTWDQVVEGVRIQRETRAKSGLARRPERA